MKVNLEIEAPFVQHQEYAEQHRPKNKLECLFPVAFFLIGRDDVWVPFFHLFISDR